MDENDETKLSMEHFYPDQYEQYREGNELLRLYLLVFFFSENLLQTNNFSLNFYVD